MLLIIKIFNKVYNIFKSKLINFLKVYNIKKINIQEY